MKQKRYVDEKHRELLENGLAEKEEDLERAIKNQINREYIYELKSEIWSWRVDLGLEDI